MTFAALLTPAGIISAGALMTLFVQIVKGASPFIDARVSGALMAFIASGVLYMAAALVLPNPTPDDMLQVFAAWVAVAGIAMGIKSGADHVASVRGGATG
jgi:hypothetical protein